MIRYGVPKGVNAQELRAEVNRIFMEFDRACDDPLIQHKVMVFAQVSGHISSEDLGKRFTI